MKKITPQMMSDATGVPTQAIRVGLQVGALKFGVAIMRESKYTYFLFPEKVREIVGDKQMAEWGY
jgi:hypothetical protein